MPLPQAAPEEGGQARGEHFAYATTEANARWHAYIAGPAQWVWCHQPKKTKPCLTILTNRAVECPWCGTTKEVVRRAYVPVYRQVDNAPRSIIVSDLYEETLAKLKLHDRVQIGKEGEKGDPVWIIKALTPQPTFQTTLRHRFEPADITCTLLRLWGSEALSKWYAQSCKASDNAVSLPEGTAVRADGSPLSPMLQAAGKRQGFDVLPPAPEDTDAEVERERELLRAVQRGEKPSTNGHHKAARKKKGS